MPDIHAIDAAKNLFKWKRTCGEKIAPRHHHDGNRPNKEGKGSVAVADGVGEGKPTYADSDDCHDGPNPRR